MPLVSIGVTVYGAEAYLDACLGSIAAQTFADFECLLIDDASPDGSGAICDAWAARDPRFRAIHKENGGEASGWRRILAEARGRWLFLFDNDDIIAPHAVETVLAQQARTPHSMVLWRWTDDLAALAAPGGPPAVTRLGPASLGRMYLDELFYYTWGRLFDLDLLRRTGLLPRLGILYGGDMIFDLDYARTALAEGSYTDFVLLEQPLYWYRTDNAGSVTARLRPNYCADELQATGYLLDLWAGQPGIPQEDHQLCLLHRLRTMAEGVGYVLVQEEGAPAARRQKAQKVLQNEAFQRLLAECGAQKLYSPHAFWLRRGMVRPSGFLYRLKTARPRWYHRFYWAGYWLHTALTGQKSPLLF